MMIEKGKEMRYRDAAKRESILSAAIALFAERGYAHTRIADIAGRTGIAPGTVYLYFSNKEDVFRTIVTERMLPLVQMAGGDPDTAASTEALRAHLPAALFASYRAILSFYRANAALLTVLNTPSGVPALDALVDDLRQRVADRNARALQALIEQGAVRPLRPDIVAHALAGMAFRVGMRYIVTEGIRSDEDIDHLARELTNLELYGIVGGDMLG